jgi:MFS family permease
LALQQPPKAFWGFAAWMLPGCMFLYVYYSGVYATIQDIVEPALRGTAMAMYFFAMYLLGAAQGPVVTGWLSDHIAQRAKASGGSASDIELARAIGLHDAMYLIPAVGIALVVVLVAGSRTVKRDYEKLQARLENGANYVASE